MSLAAYDAENVKVRKPHTCAYCLATIEIGSRALHEHGIFDGRPFTRYACECCKPNIGEFWDWAEGESGDISGDYYEFMVWTKRWVDADEEDE